MKIDSIFFDLDGTLWDSTDAVLKSWNSILMEINGREENITKEQLMSVMGLQLADIGERFFKGVDAHYAMDIMRRCMARELQVLSKEGGKLYPGLEETLSSLSRQYPLFIVSNCNDGYIETFLEYHKLGKYFKDFRCAGETGLPKGESIKSLIKKYRLMRPVFIGDTKSDHEAAELACIPFVYASYGFGDVEYYDYKIDMFRDLIKLFA